MRSPNSSISSVGSVKARISNAVAKLGVDNRVQLAILAHESRSPVEPGGYVETRL